jgi:hypothetical protein
VYPSSPGNDEDDEESDEIEDLTLGTIADEFGSP